MRPFVLFLPGVTADDYSHGAFEEETIFEEMKELREAEEEEVSGESDFELSISGELEIEEPRDDVTVYDSIPKYFAGKKSWIKQTNLMCWMCGNAIPGVPWTVPISWIKTTDDECESEAKEYYKKSRKIFPIVREGKVMEVHSVQCSEFCAIRYIRRVRDDRIQNVWESEKLFLELYRQLTGKAVQAIPEALDKSAMKQYCGSEKGVDIAEFREMNSRLKKR
jgi:hypothetical protein